MPRPPAGLVPAGRMAPRQIRCWRGATLDGDMPRRGGVPAGVVAGEEQRSTGTCPVVAASPPGSLLARSNARRGHAPSWLARRLSTGGDRPWREMEPLRGHSEEAAGCSLSRARRKATERQRKRGLCPIWKRNRGLTATAKIVLALRRALDRVGLTTSRSRPSGSYLSAAPYDQGHAAPFGVRINRSCASGRTRALVVVCGRPCTC